MIAQQLRYYPTVTRHSYRNMGRVTDLISSGKLFEDLQLLPIEPTFDRVMICGSAGMLKDIKTLLEQKSFTEGNTSRPGGFVIERAFADQ